MKLRYLIPLVAIAGALGALLRFGLGLAVPEQGMKFPWTTFAINLSGSAFLGLLVGIQSVWPRKAMWVRPVFGTGLLASYSTFSAVILAMMPALPGGRYSFLDGATYLSPGTAEMFAYLIISIIGSTGAAAAGITIGRAIFAGPVHVASAPTAPTSQHHGPHQEETT